MNLHRRSLAVLIAACFVPGTAWSNPYGAQVVSGQASISRQGAVTSITNTPGAIINWRGFSIGAGETTRFIQQSASSSVLNRVVGQNPSQILGSLESNGRVFLINPNGILFGAGSRVDVNGLVASTLAMSNEDFLAGRLNFRAGDKAGSIVNQGTITTAAGGRVYLVAPDIENSGVISTPQGATLLAAGRQVSLVDAASPYVDVIVSAPADRALNVGEIVAHGGSIGVYGALINQRGRIDADSMVVGQNGRIVLKASGDTLLEAGSRTSARGAGTGGTIHVLGERVGLTGDAKVDASGNLGGGTVLVGGDYQGKNSAVQNAKQTFIGSDAEIRVDALESGDGGKAIAWSDGLTRVYGSISARGGQQSGNGGFVETSGKTLDMQGRVDTRAPHGRTGTLLLDPANIYIAASQANATAADMSTTDTSASTGPSPFGPSGSAPFDSLLTTATLAAALESSSVVVSTDIGGSGSSGFINVVDSFSWSAPNSLTLNASGSVFGNGTISGASLVVNANGGINLRTQVASLAAVDVGNDTGITFVNTGNLTLQNITQSGSHGTGISITNNGGGLFVLAGSTISASGSTGNVALTSAAGISPGGTITAGGLVTLNGPTIAPSVLLATPAAEPVKQVINTTVNIINTVIASAAQPAKPIGPPAPSVDAMRAAEAAARAAADAAARAAAEAVTKAVADAAASAAAAAAKAAEVAADAMAAAQAAAKVAADVSAKAAAYEAEQVAKAAQLAASASTDTATVARAAADAAAKAAADTAAMKAKADADAQAAVNAAVRAKADADAKAAAAEKAEADAKKDDKKDEAKKDDKKEVAATDKSGAKKDDAAKKMYCN